MSITRRTFLGAAGALSLGAMMRLPAAEPEAADLGVATGVNPFAADLYAKLRGEKGNVFVSPLGICAALGMTAAGAKGETLTQMAKVLHLSAQGGSAQHRKFNQLIHSLYGPQRKARPYQLDVANAIWAQNGYPWREEFKQAVRNLYEAELNDVDFKAAAEKNRESINKWVAEKTREKIKDLFAPGTIDQLTRLVLVNAVYFKSQWETPFSKAATKDMPFLLADGTKQDVPMMYQKAAVRIADGDAFHVLELLYAAKQTSMLIVLPRKTDGLPGVESNATAENWAKWTKDLKPAGDVQIYLPRFKVSSQFTLNDTLKAMGMGDAFDFDKADFGNMVTSKPEGPLAITSVVHKAYCDVNEEGTEAAAATGVVVGVRSAPAKPKVFKADHPFLFAIRHNPTDTILFLGRMDNPKA